MTKKNLLLTTIGFGFLCTLFAFTYPESVRDQVLTLFFPTETRAVAAEPALPSPAVAFPGEGVSLLGDGWAEATVAPRDTNPPYQERYDDFIQGGNPNMIDLQDPKAVEQQVEYDPVTGMYIITEKIGDEFFRSPTYMTFDEYVEWRDRKQQQEYFDRLQGVESTGTSSTGGIVDPIAKFNIKNSLIDRLFGGTNVDIRPQGNINLTFGYDYQKIQNPILTLRQQRIGNFDFDMDINMSATGKIGEKLNLAFNYNTQATFDFDNQMKLNYDTKGFSEDEIVQNIEAGNVSMPLRSNLIRGAQNLFGIKTELKFGHLRTTLVASQQRSRQQSLTVQGGSQVQTFEKPIDEYDENRHFFLTHYNRNTFEKAMSCLPVPQSLFNITRLEVWITDDRGADQNTRPIVALADLGEPEVADSSLLLLSPPARDINGRPLPDNNNNELYPLIRAATQAPEDTFKRHSDRVVSVMTGEFGLRQVRDFEKTQARLLSPSEFSYHEQLGFISINLNVQPDQVVGMAVEYTYNGRPYKIGEFSSDVSPGSPYSQNVLFVKMLKSTTANVHEPIWDLMMKNVYAIGSANVDPQEFRFDIFYEDATAEGGRGQKRFLDDPDVPEMLRSVPLLQVFRLDTLNLQGDPGPDGIFDFVPGLTINLRSGRILFPVLEPFGDYLSDKLEAQGADSMLIHRYIYPQLYDSTLFRAREFLHLNRFTLRGSYKSSTSAEISLGTFNLPQGSVRVTAGGRQLTEGVHYSIDYNIGKVRILDDAILQSGQSVNVSFEDNTLFGFQSRTMLGARFDYELNKDVNIGATFMNLFERPLTQKVNFGDDPINNKMYGLDFNISKGAPWLTKLVDRIPLLSTKEPSSITAQAEVAMLDPGHNRAINQGKDKGGIVYIDDFEGSTSNVTLASPANQWVIASTPQGDQDLFPETMLGDSSRARGANRAGMAWYIADPSARDQVDQDNPYTQLVQFQDIFPNRQLSPLEQSVLRPLDVTIYPRERGPYNFEIPGGYPGVTKGLTTFGELVEPETRWAGFMRAFNTNDFEAANIEFIEFWMLNPYMEKSDGDISQDGDMYIELGNVSEDIMKDSRQFFENALPTGPGTGYTVNTRWGRVPVLPPIVNAFDNDPAKRALQDLGLDGLDDAGETTLFEEWVTEINNSSLTTDAKNRLLADPSADNYIYFRDPAYQSSSPGLLTRYRYFNNQEGNSPQNETDNLNPSATNYPDAEDLNRDNSLNENESYFRYRIPLAARQEADGIFLDVENDTILRDIVTDQREYTGDDNKRYVWYRFKVPLDLESRQKVGLIQDFRSIRFIRMYWKNFSERTTFRFATLELGRNQWRRFTQPLVEVGVGCDDPTPSTEGTEFDVNAVSIEENAARAPFNYTIPPDIQREQSVGAFPDVLQNEQALAMNICGLEDCDARAVFKTLNMDLRQFKVLKMFAHAESKDPTDPIQPGELKMFIRLGSDFINNYYEYEIPLIPSDPTSLPNNNPDSRDYKEAVWRPENNIEFPLELLTIIKQHRNDAGQFTLPYSEPDPAHPQNNVKIFGNPNLGYVKGIMVGVRNVYDAGQPACVEVWINELRLNGFNEQGGYAGLARVDMKMADFGNVSMSSNYSSNGWGSIEEKLVQRQREEIIQYDISTNLELGKFLGEKSGIKVPFYAQYSNTTSNPQYDPYDLDIKLKDKLRNEPDANKRDSIRTLAQDVSVVRGYNFTNVRKERRGNKKPWPWNIENFSLTYAFNQQQRRTPFLIVDRLNQYRGGLDYQYATGLKPITPFKKLIKKDKYLKFLSEFNFNPIPNTYGFSTNVDRNVGVTTYRFAGEDPAKNTYYNRRFTWDRNYDLGWDITRGLRFNFDATARSIIDEPHQFNEDGTPVTKQQRRDSILNSIRHLGRPKAYTHNASINYTLPFKQIPFLDFITVKASYTAGFSWTAQSLKLQNLDSGTPDILNTRHLGNVIQNNNTRQINGDLDFTTLYNKSKYLQKLDRPAKKGSAGRNRTDDAVPGRGRTTVPGDDIRPGGDPGDPGGNPPPGRNRGNRTGGDDPGSKDRTTDTPPPNATNPPTTPPDNRALRPGDPANTGRPGITPGNKDTAPGAPGAPVAPGNPGAPGGVDNTGKPATANQGRDRAKKDREPSMAERIAIRPLLLLRKVRFTYSEAFGSVVPGFTPDPKLMGLSEGFVAPGWEYVAGLQPNNAWLDRAASDGWITQRPELNQQVTRNYTTNFDAGATIEPFKDFRVELSANRQYTKNNTELFKDQLSNLSQDSIGYQHLAQRDLGSYTISYFTLNTLFNNDLSGLFNRLEANRVVISNRLGVAAGITDPHDKPEESEDGYLKGYGRIHQEVLIPSFLAAYTDTDPNKIGLNVFKTAPAINWKLNYNGLSKIGGLEKIFSSVQISHGYKSTMTVNSYNTDLFYNGSDPYGTLDEINSNYIARYEIPQIVISEQLQPLLGVDVKLKNEMTFRADLKKTRQLAMSFVDYNLAESRSSAYTVGFGYRVKNVNIPLLTGKKSGTKAKSKSKKKTTKPNDTATGGKPADKAGQGNDLTFKFDFEIRDDITLNHSLDQLEEPRASRGARTVSINPQVEYSLNKRLKLRLFTDYRKTVPKTSQSFPITTINSGVTVQFSLN